jgi:hypothetical protein
MLVIFMTTDSLPDLLAQIADIPLMERGKLSAYTFKERARSNAPYYKLQRWEHGQNVTRYIPAAQVPLLEQALAGHAQFQALVEQYAQTVIARTREQLAAVGTKKKSRPARRPTSVWRRSRKSRR